MELSMAHGVSTGFVLVFVIVTGFLVNFLFKRKGESRGRKQSDGSVVDDSVEDEEKGKLDDEFCKSVKKYNWDEIVRLTMNFSRVIGSGGFSTVYLADLISSGSTLGVVKILINDHLKRVFKQELEILLNLRHDNDQETLQEKLHGSDSDSTCNVILFWRRRMTIAFQLGQAIEYLHEKCNLQIVHGDIKASNILLDENLNCKLCDFGSAKMGFSSTVMPTKKPMMGSPGYTDRHYITTGIASKKNDIYSYGVIILELATGMQAFCSTKCQRLTSIAGPMLKDIEHCEAHKLKEMVDPLLGGEFDMEEARAMLSISCRCLGESPSLRPSATQILLDIENSVSSISFVFSHGNTPSVTSANT
ncbi:putative receptor protein kinase [Tripterygium wilfordii]|uniref:non-specific serine/threonine protein kinase n=1 Tax=Tripterygium wilfordii TaxID=458696 RepID=A0A7J7D782_TRIWF|nr:putative receptor protein kinase [Tripterygium wilfordii]